MDVVMRHGTTGKWLRFTQPMQVISAWHLQEVLPALARVEAAVEQQKVYAAGYIAYEAAPAFDKALQVHMAIPEVPLLCFGIYHSPEVISALPDPTTTHHTLGSWLADMAFADYEHKIQRVKEYIARGDTYQVNLTLRLRTSFEGETWPFFLELQRAQRSLYSAYLEFDDTVLCSVSPELFFTLEGNRLLSRPMKGTAGRGFNLASDHAQMQWLQASEKNRAENVMIVDMIRNDMGKVAEVGSVTVPALFEVERYPTVLQMTSTVESRTTASLVQIMQALFPCASITGAPKVRTMQIIAELEDAPRGIYTGTIGFLAPDRRAQFNVSIRTVMVQRDRGQAEYGVGGAIVWDSSAEGEYEECRQKSRVLTESPADFALLESLLWEPGEGYFLLDRHLDRLQEAAAFFVIPLDMEEVRAALEDKALQLPAVPHKVRLTVSSRQGTISWSAHPLGDDFKSTVRAGLAQTPISTDSPFLYFKTTRRDVYDQALAERPDCDDVILYNERGEITESTRANVVLQFGSSFVTPPVSSGLLAGTYRAELLANGHLREQTLSIDDLFKADRIYFLNSVRRWMSVDLILPDDARRGLPEEEQLTPKDLVPVQSRQ